MNIADKILQNQDRDGMLRRSLERIIQLYTDKSHFVYELLQNAEDAGATGIRFVQYSDRLEVMHDGKSFTTENLQGLCDIGQSDKVNDLNQIGEFGVGFKSVFGICETVTIQQSQPLDAGSVLQRCPFRTHRRWSVQLWTQQIQSFLCTGFQCHASVLQCHRYPYRMHSIGPGIRLAL